MFITMEVTRPAMLFRKFGVPQATISRTMESRKRGRQKRNCILPRVKAKKAISAQRIIPEQVPSAAPMMPRSSTNKNKNSKAALRMDIRMLSSMLPRTLPQMRR